MVMAAWGEPYAYDEDDGVSWWALGAIVLTFAILTLAGIISAGGPS
jgi:hypothetical protein